jgi:transcriptional regulator with XRE-family HTH domain
MSRRKSLDFHEKCKIFLIIHGLSTEAVARRARVTRTMVGYWMRQERRSRRVTEAFLALGLPTAWLRGTLHE